jgi:NhaP-type Na+/H+ or K+/H+ antiporter
VNDIEFLIAVLFAAAVLVRLADLISIPYPIVLVVGGVAIGFVPGLPAIKLEPEAIFLIFLPPLLQSAGFNASPQELRAATAQLVSLTFALVLVTMAVVAVVAHAVIDGMSWQAAFVLGAILAPTDPVAAAAAFSRMGVPERIVLAVEGEAMLNDAAALAAYKVALAAAASGTFALGPGVLDFVSSAACGVAFGLAVAWVGVKVQRKLSDVPLAILLTVLFSYGAYIGAEHVGDLGLGVDASGVLATVTAGVWYGWHSHEMFDADTRLSTLAFWQALVFGLNVTLFVLLGLQFEGIYESLRSSGDTAALLVDIALVRRERLVVGWSGMRGAISLAAALSLPEVFDSGATFAQHDELIFVTVGVIAVTLIGQGLTLPPLLKALGLHGEREWSPDEAIARLEAAQAALDRLDELEREERITEERLRRMRELYRARFRRCMAVIGGEGGEEARESAREPIARYSALRRELIGVERSAILGLRNEGKLKPDIMREIERDLDLEEARLPA